jgi:site-specific DNA-methyltransferase (adenine-specific)
MTYEETMNSIKCGDCLELMKEIPDKSIDLILCDLPYGQTACKWDSVIPFESLWKQYKRIIKDNGAIVLFGSEPFSSELRHSNLQMYKYDWIWEKPQGVNFAQFNHMPMSVYETISVFGNFGLSKNAKIQPIYNPQGVIEINKPKKAKTYSEHRPTSNNKDHIQKFSNYPRQIIQFKAARGFHPTQKPVALLEYLIRTYTNEGDTVLDNCMGSGSTGVACINENRNFIGYELNEEYFNIAQNRLREAWKERKEWSNEINRNK